MFEEIGSYLDDVMRILFSIIALFFPHILVKEGSDNFLKRRRVIRVLGMISLPGFVLLAFID